MTPAAVALKEAFTLQSLLPSGAVWSIMITHDTGSDLPAAFNVWVKDDIERGNMRQHLKLGTPEREDDNSEQHNYSPRITLSIIEETE